MSPVENYGCRLSLGSNIRGLQLADRLIESNWLMMSRTRGMSVHESIV